MGGKQKAQAVGLRVEDLRVLGFVWSLAVAACSITRKRMCGNWILRKFFIPLQYWHLQLQVEFLVGRIRS